MEKQRLNPARLTVAIPLFNGADWEQTVLHNIQLIPADARIVLSDEVSSDDTAIRIGEYLVNDPRIMIRTRDGKTGWREHCNALINENESEFFSLLPQDDRIEAGYYEKLIIGLDENPGAGLAFGSLLAVRKSNRHEKLASPPFKPGSSTPWAEAVLLERYWNMGIPFRGIIRREILRKIPPTPEDQFADKLWVFSMALSAFLLEVPDAVYLKCYHSHNTHTDWNPLSEQQRKVLLEKEIRNVFGKQQVSEQVTGYMEQIYACPKTTCEKFYIFLKRFLMKGAIFGRKGSALETNRK